MSARLHRCGASAFALALAVIPSAVAAQEAGSVGRFGSVEAQQIEVSAGTDDSSASIAFELSGHHVTTPRDKGVVTSYFEQTSLIVSTPFDGKNDAAPATLDGLANGTKLTIRWGRFGGAARLGLAPDAAGIVQQATEICRGQENDSFAAALNAAEAEPIEKQAAASQAADEQHRKALIACTTFGTNSHTLVAKYLPTREREYIAAQVPHDAYDVGIEASVAYRQFDYVDPSTFAPLDSKKAEFSAKFYYTRYLRQSRTALTGSIGYEHTYKAADDVTLCPTAGSGPSVTCKSAAPAGPSLDQSLLLAAGIRHRFARPDGTAAPFAIAPLLTYDALDNIFGVDVPFYFFSDGKTGLSGGVRGGWRSDTKKVTFGVFVGTSFNLLK